MRARPAPGCQDCFLLLGDKARGQTPTLTVSPAGAAPGASADPFDDVSSLSLITRQSPVDRPWEARLELQASAPFQAEWDSGAEVELRRPSLSRIVGRNGRDPAGDSPPASTGRPSAAAPDPDPPRVLFRKATPGGGEEEGWKPWGWGGRMRARGDRGDIIQETKIKKPQFPTGIK